jgi:hypothetical protein
LDTPLIELITRSRLSGYEAVRIKLNRIEQVYNAAQFPEVIEGFAQQNKQVNVAGPAGSVAGHRPVQDQSLELRTIMTFKGSPTLLHYFGYSHLKHRVFFASSGLTNVYSSAILRKIRAGIILELPQAVKDKNLRKKPEAQSLEVLFTALSFCGILVLWTG